jgi:multisubunit Na+/H+ antiporter MnhE subunit
MAAWLLLTLTIDPVEVAAGAVAAAIAATVAELVRVQDLQTIRVRPRWLLRTLRLPRAILVDSWKVLATLLSRPPKSAFFALPLDPGDDDDPYAAGRRALITAAISVTPNTYVVGIDADRNLILVHQLVPASPSKAEEEILGRL